MYRIVVILLAALCAVSCGRRSSRQQTSAAPQMRVFLPAIAPSSLSDDAKRDYLRWHYWDRFDFTDTLFVSEADTVQMIEAFARYIAVLSDRPADSAPMDSLMRRASSSKPMLDYFAMLAGTVLHDPNSPLRNDEFYIPVLRAQLASPFYDEYERIAPQYDLEMAMQNRLGQPANDFRYTLASGASGTLYGLQAEYVLLFINNPGCAMCREIREAITSSPMLSEMIERGRLKVLALYPDEDLTEWRDYRDHIPASWINAYDKGCVVREKSLSQLTVLLYLIMYMLMFSAAIVLRYKMKGTPRPFRLGKKNGLMWFLGCLGFCGALLAFVLSFVPPSQISTGSNTVWFSVLIIGCVVVVGAPFVIYSMRKPSWKDPEAAADFAPFHWEAQAKVAAPEAAAPAQQKPGSNK